mgnify:CR=1 FL=1
METIRQRHNSFKRTHEEEPLDLEGPSDPIGERKMSGSFLNSDVAETFSSEELVGFDKENRKDKVGKGDITSKDILNQQQRQNMQNCSPLGECGHEEAMLTDEVEIMVGEYHSDYGSITINEYSINTRNRTDRELIDNANRSYNLNEETDNNKDKRSESDKSLNADKEKIEKAEEQEKHSNGNLDTNGKS